MYKAEILLNKVLVKCKIPKTKKSINQHVVRVLS